MLNLPTTQLILKQILDLQTPKYANEAGEAPIFDVGYLEAFSKNDNSVKIIFDHVHFKIVYISGNVEQFLGYPAKDFLDNTLLFPLQLFSLEHQNFIYIWLKWVLERRSQYSDCYKTKQVMCGVSAKHKDSHMLRLLFRHSFITEADDVRPKFSVMTVDDISHLIKTEFNWGRIDCSSDSRTIHHFYSTDTKEQAHDILSDKEKNVLRLLAEGKDFKEIAALLQVNPETIKKYERSMRAKMGMKDMTALIIICKMVGII
jgi:DNA-binding CsgD family transcriptional regulator